MHPNLIGDKAHLERFRREARIMAILSHPALVGVIDAGDDGLPYIVTEWIDGQDLKETMRISGSFGSDAASRVVSECADGLAFAHRHDVVHQTSSRATSC